MISRLLLPRSLTSNSARAVIHNHHRRPSLLLTRPSLFSTMSRTTDNQLTPESLSQKLTEKLQATHIAIEDFSGGCGQAFEAIVVSPQFENKRMLARHRMVNDVLKDEIAAIHAWSPKCFTPEEWERKRNEVNGI